MENAQVTQEIYQFMGRTSKAIENIEKTNSTQIEEAKTARSYLKKEIKDVKIDLKEVAKAAECPHADKFKLFNSHIMACVSDRGRLFGERKYVYGALGVIIAFLGIVIKLVWEINKVQ